MDNCIDFVMPWVNGGDPAWAAERSLYREDTDDVCRYRDWDNLHYWFRSVENFAPWVNCIHFITWGHLPSWLNTGHPKLHIVNHADYIPAEYLPTFSSHPIELNIHRIQDLSERFVYFNDDMFITRPTKPDAFFRGGLPCAQASLDYIPSANSRIAFQHILMNDTGVINRHFNKTEVMKRNCFKWYHPRYGAKANVKTLLLSWANSFPGIKMHHLPASFLKSTFEEVWEREKETLNETCMRKFRDCRDVSQRMFQCWQLASGLFYPINTKSLGRSFSLPRDARPLFEAIRKQLHPMVCANDTEDCVNFEELQMELINSFESILPQKSSFEV